MRRFANNLKKNSREELKSYILKRNRRKNKEKNGKMKINEEICWKRKEGERFCERNWICSKRDCRDIGKRAKEPEYKVKVQKSKIKKTEKVDQVGDLKKKDRGMIGDGEN